MISCRGPASSAEKARFFDVLGIKSRAAASQCASQLKATREALQQMEAVNPSHRSASSASIERSIEEETVGEESGGGEIGKGDTPPKINPPPVCTSSSE